MPSNFTALPGCPHVPGYADCYADHQDEGNMIHTFQELLQEELTHTQVSIVNRMNPTKCYVSE